VDDTFRDGRVADLLDAARWPVVLGLSFAGVFLLLGLPWALIDVAGLLFLDLLADLLTTGRGAADGRTGGSSRA
jgi:hypothetical protein